MTATQRDHPDFVVHVEQLMKEQPGIELFDCPECLKKMWVSKKKRKLLKTCQQNNVDYLYACWNCMKEDFSENKDLRGAKEIHYIDLV